MEIRKVLALLGVMLLVYFLFLKNNKAERTSMDDLEELDLVLTGKVAAVHELPSSNGFAVVNVDVIRSNVAYYDPRDKYEHYYCLIKNNKAEFYQQSARDCIPGDTVEIKVKKREFICRNKERKIEREIKLYTNTRYFRRVEKQHQDF